MIIGNISGVSPTATDRANSRAWAQLCFVMPTMTNVRLTITIMNRIISQVKDLIPVSKLVSSRLANIFCDSAPKNVWAPVVRTTARAEPLRTLVPMKQALGDSSGVLPAAGNSAVFSTGMDSPVSADCVTKKSLADKIRISAGIRLPAASTTTSPGTTSSKDTSTVFPSRITSVAVFTNFCNCSTARDDRVS